MTSVVMIFEMTRDYAVIVPLMIANLVSLFISSRLQHEPIYEVLAHQDGIHLPKAESRSSEGQRRVSRVMRPATEVLDASLTALQAIEKVSGSRLRQLARIGHERSRGRDNPRCVGESRGGG